MEIKKYWKNYYLIFKNPVSFKWIKVYQQQLSFSEIRWTLWLMIKNQFWKRLVAWNYDNLFNFLKQNKYGRK